MDGLMWNRMVSLFLALIQTLPKGNKDQSIREKQAHVSYLILCFRDSRNLPTSALYHTRSVQRLHRLDGWHQQLPNHIILKLISRTQKYSN